MREPETKMSALSRYTEEKYLEFHNISKDSILANRIEGLIDTISYLSIIEYVINNGIDDYLVSIYDEPFEHWNYGVAIRSYRSTKRKKKSIWQNYKHYLGIPYEYSSEKLQDKFEPLLPYLLKHIELNRNFFEMMEDIWEFPKHRENVDRLIHEDKLTIYTLEDIERTASWVFMNYQNGELWKRKTEGENTNV